ncbi:MAG: hypothetical protein IK119_09820, partial [Bacteroidales bacterium]|nr:hypothetical protein [Bacteroidales bacterium]
MKKVLSILFLLTLCMAGTAQTVQSPIRLYPDFVPSIQEEADYDADGLPVAYRKVTDPSITVCLPAKDKADGSAVMIFPGGAMVSLS